MGGGAVRRNYSTIISDVEVQEPITEAFLGQRRVYDMVLSDLRCHLCQWKHTWHLSGPERLGDKDAVSPHLLPCSRSASGVPPRLT